jgi:two-component system, OmpR family, response regulator RegX3
MTVTALFLFDGASPNEPIMQQLSGFGAVVRTTNSLAQAMNLIRTALTPNSPTTIISDLSTMASNGIDHISSNCDLIVADVSAGGISLAESVAEQTVFADSRPAIVLIDNQKDVGAARRALRLNVDAYLLADEPQEHRISELQRILAKATLQQDTKIVAELHRSSRNLGWAHSYIQTTNTARLSTIENAIMACLTDRVGLPVSAKNIVSVVMGRELDEDKAASLLRPHISRLRSKLEPMPQMPQHLLTVRGKGYMVV